MAGIHCSLLKEGEERERGKRGERERERGETRL
jgi:hypothetical protein